MEKGNVLGYYFRVQEVGKNLTEQANKKVVSACFRLSLVSRYCYKRENHEYTCH